MNRAPEAPRIPFIAADRARFIAIAAGAIAIFVVLAVVRGTPEDASWYVQHVGGFAAIALVASLPRVTPIATAMLATCAVVLPALALVVAFTPLDPWDEPIRLQLFTANANLLAAGTVALYLAAAAARPSRFWVFAFPAVAVAVVLTGSRTALAALGLAMLVWSVLPNLKRFERVLLMGAAATIAGFGAYALWQVDRESRLDNLIGVSTTFDARSWTVYGDSVVDVERSATPGPWPGTRADRVRAESRTSRLTLYQSLGRSRSGTEYVASVYLRANTPQEVVLSNHLSRTTCEVDATWARCVTPPGAGNDRSAIQFRFEVPEPGRGFDVYAFGPQYEIGTEATAYQARSGGIVSRHVVSRLTGAASVDGWSLPRIDRMQRAFDAFATAPWAGAGVAWATSNTTGDPGAAPVTHAHNFAAERLASDGVIGGLVWLSLIVLASLRVARTVGTRSLPFLASLLVLNALDYTFFHNGTFAASAILVGTCVGRDRLDARLR